MKLHLPLLVCLTFTARAADTRALQDAVQARNARNAAAGRPGYNHPAYSASVLGYLPSMLVDRYRKSGDRYLDLQPLFDWVKMDPVRRDKIQRPLPEWSPLRVRVSQVIPSGLLAYRVGPDGMSALNPILLRNHPEQSTLVDGKYVNVLAVRLPEPFRYRDIVGSLQTVEQLDYGIPFDPQERVKQVAAEKANGVAAPAKP